MVQRRNGYAEILGYVLWRNAVGQQLLGELDPAVGHFRLTTTLAAKLTGDYLWYDSAKVGAGTFRPLRPLTGA